eukprot:2684280-Amphidinium_carterae.1
MRLAVTDRKCLAEEGIGGCTISSSLVTECLTLCYQLPFPQHVDGQQLHLLYHNTAICPTMMAAASVLGKFGDGLRSAMGRVVGHLRSTKYSHQSEGQEADAPNTLKTEKTILYGPSCLQAARLELFSV